MKEGTDLLHYRILSRLGEGGMGVVYRAEDTRLGRTVALKILREDLASDEDWNRRFEREVRAASAVSHPGIATLYDYYREGTTAFFTMEFVEGKNLRELLEEGSLPMDVVLDASVQMADALAEAHRRGIVHRDLKPENVMAGPSGFYKILDFGLARIETPELKGVSSGSQFATMSANATQAGRLVGTVTYMSPEQAQGHTVDVRSDIFTFGSLIHELVTGTPPFARKNPIATFHAIVHEEPEPMSATRTGVPKQLQWIVTRCLAKEASGRYRSAVELAADLRALAAGNASGIGRIVPASTTTAPSRSRKGWILTAGGLLLVLVAAAFVFMKPSSGPVPVPALPGVSPPAPVGGVERVAPVGAAAPAGRSVVVAAFVNNSGDPEAGWLGNGLPEMITTELAEGEGLHVLSTRRLQDLARKAGPEAEARLGGAGATELARWAGADVVITGSIFKSGSEYRIDAQAYDTASGEVVTAAKAQGENIFDMVGELTAALREGLSLGVPPPPGHPQIRTSSEDAFRFYTAGLDQYQHLNFNEGIDAFRESIEADPNFDLAKLRLAMSLYLNGQHDEARRALEETRARAAGLPDRERRLLSIINLHVGEGDKSSIEKEIEEFTQDYPEDQEVLFWKAESLADAGNRVGAIRILTNLLDKDPDNLSAVTALALNLARLGQGADAIVILENYIELHPEAAEPFEQVIDLIDDLSDEQEDALDQETDTDG